MKKMGNKLLSLLFLISLLILSSCSVVATNCEHEFDSWRLINEATCINYGLEERSCSKCGFIENREIQPTNTHDYQFSYEEKGDCNRPGRTVFSCRYCGLEKEEKGEKSEHQYNERVLVEPNCSNEGIKLFECHVCGHSYEESIEKTSHNYVLNFINSSTCHEEGYELYQCNICGDSYQKTLEKKEHNFQYMATIPPTCLEAGYDEYYCNICGDFEHRNIVLATGEHQMKYNEGDIKCGESGYVTYSCELCPYTEERYQTSLYPTHNFVDGTCSNCNVGIYKFESYDYDQVTLVDVYDKDIVELTIPLYDDYGRQVTRVGNIDWTEFKNLYLIKFEGPVNLEDCDFRGINIVGVEVWDLRQWASQNFTYYYNNPLCNGAYITLNKVAVMEFDLSKFLSIGNYAFTGVKGDVLDYNINDSDLSSNAFDNATFNTVHVYRIPSLVRNCNINEMVINAESVYLDSTEYKSLDHVKISSNVKYIEGELSAFDYDIYVDKIEDWVSIDLQNPIFDEDTRLFVNNELATNVIIPEGVEKIGNNALDEATFIKTLSLPESLKEIGEGIHIPSLETLYYSALDIESFGYNKINIDNLGNLIIGENVRRGVIIAFENTLNELIIPQNVEGLSVRGYVENLYVYSNNLSENSCLESFDYKVMYIGENVESIHPYNFKRDNYNIEYTNNDYEIVVLNENMVFSTKDRVGEINGTITITAPVQILNQFNGSVVYNDIVITGSGDVTIQGTIVNKVTLGKGVTSVQIKDDYYTHHDYKYTLEVLGDSIEFINQFDRCKCLNIVDLKTLFTSNYTSGNPLTDGAILTYNNEEIRSVTVPSGITYLPDNIFKEYSLDSINLNEIETIGTSAFAFSKINEVITNEGLKEIKDDAFMSSNLEEFTFPSTLEKIGYRAFSQTPIKEFIPNSAIEIRDDAFNSCKELKVVNFNSYPQVLGRWAFFSCGIEYLTISYGTTGVVVDAFDGCDYVKEYDLATLDGTTSQTILKSQVPFKLTIRSGSFWPIENSNLKELVLGSETEVPTYSIASDGLLKLTILEGATLQNNIIDPNRCLKLTEVINHTDNEIIVDSEVVVKKIDDKSFELDNDFVIYNKDGKKYIVDYLGTDKSVDLAKLSSNNNYIVGKYCFGYRSSDEHPSSYDIEGVILSDNITRINDFAFGYNKISEIYIPKSVEYISPSAFAFNPLTTVNVDSLNPTYHLANSNIIESETQNVLIGTNAILDNNIKGILDYAFSGRLITQVNIPNSVTLIGYKAFERCYFIEEFIYNASVDSQNFKPIKLSHYDNPLTKVIIGEDVTILPQSFMAGSSSIIEITFNCINPFVEKDAFNGCKNLTEITFNNEFENIGLSMFKSCEKLANINANYSFNVISSDAFAYCSNLERIDALLNANRINSGAFYNAGSKTITKLDLTNVKYIHKGAFSGFNAYLEEITIDSVLDKATNDQFAIAKLVDIFGSYVYANKINYTGTILTANIFANLYYTYNIDCPNVTSIEALAFNNCSSLETINIPKVIEVADNAFNNISIIKEIILPSSVETLGNKLFVGCDSLESITLPFVGKRDLNINEFGIEQLFGEYFESAEATSTSKSGYNKISQYHYTNSAYYSETKYYYIPSTLKNITILGGTLGNSTFMNFNTLEEIKIESETISVIGSRCFYGCINLKSLEIEGPYTKILSYAFEYCESLEQFSIPKTVEAISGNPFTYTKNLSSLVVDSENPNYYSNSMNAIVEKDTNKLIVGSMNTNIDNTVKIIGDSAFMGSSQLYKIRIPSSLESFEGDNHFFGCYNLTEITGSSSVFYTSGNVLYQRRDDGGIVLVRAGKGVEEIVEGVTIIDTNAFENVVFTNGTIMLPTTISAVYNFAFGSGCSFNRIEFKEYSGPWYFIFNGVEEIDLSSPEFFAQKYKDYSIGSFTKKIYN